MALKYIPVSESRSSAVGSCTQPSVECDASINASHRMVHDKWGDFAKKKKLKHAGDPNVRLLTGDTCI